MLPCDTPQLRVRAVDSLPLTLHFWVWPLKVIPLKLLYYQTFFETWHNQHS